MCEDRSSRFKASDDLPERYSDLDRQDQLVESRARVTWEIWAGLAVVAGAGAVIVPKLGFFVEVVGIETVAAVLLGLICVLVVAVSLSIQTVRSTRSADEARDLLNRRRRPTLGAGSDAED